MTDPTKKCPMCAEHIDLNANVCPYCQARFEVSSKGYCTNCHELVTADENDLCIKCGTQVVDLHTESRFLEEPIATVQPPSPKAPKPQAPPVPKRKIRVWTCVIGLLVIAIGTIVVLSQLDLFPSGLFGGETEFVSRITKTPELIASPTVTATPEPSVTPTVTPIPPPPVIIIPDADSGYACFGTDEGVTCLDEEGWKPYTAENSLLDDGYIAGQAICPDGKMLFAQQNTVSVYDGSQWINQYRYPFTGWLSSSAVACDADGIVWLLHDNGVSSFDGAVWTDYSTVSLEEEYGNFNFTGMAVTNDGDIWVATLQHIIMWFDGADWTVFSEGRGFEDEYRFVGVGLDSGGNTWAVADDYLLMYKGTNWEVHEIPTDSTIKSMFIDSQDQIWVNTTTSFLVYQDGLWLDYPLSEEVTGGANLETLYIDASGRIWLGTNWGLLVKEGEEWTHYQMHTADLTDNRIRQIKVLGTGPGLPDLVEKQPGSLSGRILVNGEPISGATVEVCVEGIGQLYSGNTPCEKQAYKSSTKTSAEGEFIFQDLYAGRYNLAFKVPGGDWTRLTTSLGFVSQWYLVEPGENTIVADIKVKSE